MPAATRQALHEVIRRHSLAVAESVAAGNANDLLDRLTRDGAFASIEHAKLKAELNPAKYVGRAPEQVVEFLAEYLDPLVTAAQARYPAATSLEHAELRV